MCCVFLGSCVFCCSCEIKNKDDGDESIAFVMQCRRRLLGCGECIVDALT